MLRRLLHSALLGAVVVLASATVGAPAAAQFTASVSRPRAPARTQPVVIADPRPALPDTLRPTVLSDMKAWVDSAAMALKKPPVPDSTARDSTTRDSTARDSTARDSTAAVPQARPRRSSPPRRAPRQSPR